MAIEFTNQVRGERHSRALMAIDYYADRFDLANNEISIEKNMAELYISSGELVDLLNSINVMRHDYRLAPFKSGKIKHATKIKAILTMLDEA